MGLEDLGQMMAGMETYRDQHLLVGYDTSDDCGVYALSEEVALVESVDFITPIVDDPFLYGQMAASNALSDIFAMGAVPKTALNLLMWDKKHLSKEIITEILKGGASKLNEAKVTLLGGHTIADQEQKYGLSVSGIVHPKKIWRNCTAQVGDALVLSKPLGTGIIATALKNGKLELKADCDAVVSMCQLNQIASQMAQEFEIHACTDITGFGLVGHLLEMCAHDKGASIFVEKIPLFDGVVDWISKDVIPNGTRENYAFLKQKIKTSLDFSQVIACFDAQTSGGLLFALPQNQAHMLVERLRFGGYEQSEIIGQMTKRDQEAIELL
ncbi:selenide, water dikinase SelD [Helicobacter kayseriensis]|uniref:selenide, water dikinase SelD n=1 Tax=Helicobacter kayseriensis TaxID=2905877 RepID=UPI001E2ADAFC|nr:selenide, water dikinase SelD [Helicobacter kayseriensis]MCE3048643.1 selenide, water dikinase SelD [Helicobacter kayseriensis]